MKMRELWFYIAAGCALAGSALAQQGLPPECGSLRSSFGPYDYRASIGTSELNVVESFHFTSNVESLRKGNTGPVRIKSQSTEGARRVPQRPVFPDAC